MGHKGTSAIKGREMKWPRFMWTLDRWLRWPFRRDDNRTLFQQTCLGWGMQEVNKDNRSLGRR